ncbi:Ankyrin repeat-containing domain [Trinorchestia longiramus]|nr:Ankyrin repeat-containing domain [Trinorchestia longiramus]
MWQTSDVTRSEGQVKRTTDERGSLSPGTDHCKSIHDSHSDSGFLSGSNLVSSGSVEDYSVSNQSLSQRCNTIHGTSEGTHGGVPHHTLASSSAITSSGCLDSGIDISDQLSSLQLRSGPQNYEESLENNSGDTSATRRPATSPGRRDTRDPIEISRAHVSLLREVFSPDKDGDTQLHVAVMRGFIEVVYHITRLLPHQAFLDLANNTGRTALHLAVSAGVPAIARHLIVCGASPVARDLRGNTPLHVACGRKDAAMVTHLTRPVTVSEVLSAQLSYAPTHTPGLLAADLTNYQGETCVHVAAMAGDKEILQHLTWYGADVNAKECRSGRTALHLAVEARDPELVAHIVTTCRASVTIESYARLSPYQLALANGATGIATQLLDLGAPAQLLPAAYTLDEDDDEYEDQFDYNQDADSTLDGWQEVDDIRLAGVPIHSSLSAGQPLGPPPVSTAPHTINADLFF